MSRPGPWDWSAPWYAPWRDPGQAVAARWQCGMPLPEALNAAGPAPVRFVPQSALPDGEPYERHIHATGTVPTREDPHDFFHGLVWLRMPQAKRRMNALQAEQIAALGVQGRRGPVRDALTVFDENGLLLDAPRALWDALLARDWQRLFVRDRTLWSQARIRIVGHALLEKLASPRKDMTAHVWRANAPLAAGDDPDAWLAAQCTAQSLAAKPFTPLPVLGIPGWWEANQNFSFYEDSTVFRPARLRSPGAPPPAGPVSS